MAVDAGAREDNEDAAAAVPSVAMDLKSAALLSGAYGLAGAVAAVLLIPEVAQRTEVRLPLPVPVFAILLAVQLTVIYGLLGWAGLRMARGRGLEPAPMLTAMWRDGTPRGTWRGLLAAAPPGLLVGLALVAAVWAISRTFPGTLPDMLHPPGVLSALAASTAAAFGEEILCRLFILSAILRLLPRRARWAPAAAIAGSALAFGALHTPGMVALYGGAADVPALAWVWIVGLNTLGGIVFGVLYLRWGVGAAIAGHWFCNLAWHVGSVAA